MCRARIFPPLVAAVCVALFVEVGQAQLEDFVWIGGAGGQQWQVQANWTAPPFGPTNGQPYPYTIPTFPNDPNRMDSDTNGVAGDPLDNIVFPSVGANLSVALGGNLTVDVGATDMTVASLKLGGTAGAVTTTVSSSGGKLVFENFEANDTTPVDPNPDFCAFNCTAAQITSGGVAGSTNIISAPVHLNGERLEFAAASTNNITLSGPLTFANLTGNGRQNAEIRSFMPSANKVTISGTVTLVDTATGAGALLTIHTNGQVPPSPPTNTTIQSVPSTGVIEISGDIKDDTATTGTTGTINIGTTGANQALGTIILSGNNTYRGQTTLNRANLVLGSDTALGVDSQLGNDRAGGAIFANGNPNNNFGFNLESNNDARTITVDASFAQWQAVKGSNSLTWSGMVTANNTRGWVNLLPEGKKLTVSGLTYASTASQNDVNNGESVLDRIFTYDGTGRTEVTGGWRDRIVVGNGDHFNGSQGHFRKTGSGTLVVSDPGSLSDFIGDVIVDMGLVRFATDTIFDQSRVVTSTGGAIGVDTGTFNSSTLLTKLDFTDHGGLMLTPGEAGISINFTLGDLANAKNMSVGAHENGVTFTGSIVPSTDALTARETYRLGGGGPLTMNGAQLTGNRDVQITNGGEVRLNGANTYTGVTTVLAKYHNSVTNQAAANTNSNINNIIFDGTILSTSNLASGASSGVGGASDAAGNLVIQGSTLKYTGATASTNRLFTVGTGGATIDASGGGAITFNNTGALAMDVAEDRVVSYYDDGTNKQDGVAGGFSTLARLAIAKTDDLVIGMPIVATTLQLTPIGGGTAQAFPNTAVSFVTSTMKNPELVYSQSADNSYPGGVTINPAVTLTNQEGTGMVAFGGVARTLTLSGLSTTDNTMKPLISNAPAVGVGGGSNVVNLAKSGAGKWILTNNNDYTGTTSVNAGTLLVNGAHSGTGAVTVAAGATLGGIGSLAGAVTNNGRINAGASVGTLTLGAGLTMGANSFLDVELLTNQADKLMITGNLDLSALGQSLNVIDLGKTGTQWTIAEYTGALTGTFESITSGYSVDYGVAMPGKLLLNFAGGVAGDYNSDGTVNTADYVVWREAQSLGLTGLPNEGGISPGSVDQLDYNFWRSRFGATSGAGAGLGITAGANVPEPATWLIAAVICGALSTAGRSRRRK